MIIYGMTATFGKLNHETLTLHPGLNIISAPNEWGKSTWCAFLLAMFYGLDTRTKSTKRALSDREHYAPWSGAPMSGRIDLNWNGRDITIERSTRQRVPLGAFRAYETQSGIDIPELTADNCGQMLLGVEREVYRRAGFVRHADMPVTQDDDLRRRLNALVTTGDETNQAQKLADQLRELRNRCRYNRTGLLPTLENERDALEKQISELETLTEQSDQMKKRLLQTKAWIAQLENHRQTMAYEAYQENEKRLSQAKLEQAQSKAALEQCVRQCRELPGKPEIQRKLDALRAFRDDWYAFLQKQQKLPQKPQPPQMQPPYEGMTMQEAMKMVKTDVKQLKELSGAGKMQSFLLITGFAGLLAAVGLWFLQAYLFVALAGFASLAGIGWGIWDMIHTRQQIQQLRQKYNFADPQQWADPITQHRKAMSDYYQELKEYNNLEQELQQCHNELEQRRTALCADREAEELIEELQSALSRLDALEAARRVDDQARRLVQNLSGILKPVDKPSAPDTLTQSAEETEQLLAECGMDQQRLQNRLGQVEGRIAVLGDIDQLRITLKQKRERIASLEKTYEALTIAQKTLSAAMTELQRRFAPRITKNAQVLLSRMTGGKYSSVIMLEDFSLETASSGEDTMRGSLWRSDGTIDQLYLALRLAVAQELTPDAPMVLDDCLVRFDEERMRAAVEMLKQIGQFKQIILFSCHNRESQV